mmetsp:Transcript_2551/g.7545  ORF Transcript_2551/g.7545 Transcript_2551/m.7545 type:complete len:663 (-) Transcript_2551:1220-3208(-)
MSTCGSMPRDPKLRPYTCTVFSPYDGPRGGDTLCTTGGSYVNSGSALLSAPPTPTTTCSAPAVPAGSLHRISPSFTYVSCRHAVPPMDAYWPMLADRPNRLPRMLSHEPPYVGPCDGCTESTSGGLYSYSCRLADDCSFTTTATDAAPASPSGTTHSTSSSDTSRVDVQARPPTYAVGCILPAPRYAPRMTTLSPPYVGPDAGSTARTMGGSYRYTPVREVVMSRTLTTTSAGPGSADGTTHVSSSSLFSSTCAHSWRPTVTVGTACSSPGRPRCEPVMLMRMPPYAGPRTGSRCITSGPWYVYTAHTASPGLHVGERWSPTRIVTTAAPSLSTAAGTSHSTLDSDSHLVLTHGWPPTMASTATSALRPKYLPCNVTLVPPYEGPLAGLTCCTSGVSYRNSALCSATFVPSSVAVTRTSPAELGGAVHSTSPSATHSTSAHGEEPNMTLGSLSFVPRLWPTTDTRKPPYVGPLTGLTLRTTGPWYMNTPFMSRASDDLPSTLTTTGAGPGRPGGTLHRSVADPSTCTSAHSAPPTVTLGTMMPWLRPSHLPCTVSSYPPSVLPDLGLIDTTDGASYMNTTADSPSACSVDTRTTAGPSMLGGSRHCIVVSLTHAVFRQGAPPTVTGGFCWCVCPKLAPCSVTIDRPYVGPVAGSTVYTTGSS